MAELTALEKGRLSRYRNIGKNKLSEKQTADMKRLVDKAQGRTTSGNTKSDNNRAKGKSTKKTAQNTSKTTRKKLTKREVAESALTRALNKWKKGQASIQEVDDVIQDYMCAVGQTGIKAMCGKANYKYKVFKKRNKRKAKRS